MAEKRNLFPSTSEALGKQRHSTAPELAASLSSFLSPPSQPFIEVAAECAPLARFAVITRDGRFWSYPYSHLGLIECHSQDSVLIHCTCGTVSSIEIRGRGLRRIAECLTTGRLHSVYETEHQEFAHQQTVVTAVSIITPDEPG